jgi:hypothetical protein
MEAINSSEALEDIHQAMWRHISENCNNFQPFTGPIDRRGEHLDTLFICDLFHEGVGSDILQRRTLRWLVNIEESSQN